MHIAVGAMIGNISGRAAGCNWRAITLFALSGLCAPVPSMAQPTFNPGDQNLQAEPVQEQPAEVSRRVQRLGDVLGEPEWKPELSVPGQAGVLPYTSRLPDEQQQRQLLDLLARLAENPGDEAAAAALDLLLDDVVDQADKAIDDVQLDKAGNLLAIVVTVDPHHAGLDAVRARLVGLGEVAGQLVEARKALEEGRVYQPDNHSAWYYYRSALDQSPDNEAALRGLQVVQQHMIARSMEFAEELDFDSADRLLEEAAFVRDDPEAIQRARLEMDQVRSRRAEQLESNAVLAMDSGDFAGAERALIDLIALGGQEVMINQLRRRLEEARVYGGFQPGQIIRDHFLTQGKWAPDAVILLAGSFLMGSPPFEEGRQENEGPQHRVTFRRGFAIGQKEVSVAQFRMFVDQSGYRTDAERAGESTIYNHFSGRLTRKQGVNWALDYEGKPAGASDPVVHVSWNDAQAYADWLARGTGKAYRLPTEAEFEYALRGGSVTRFWWGDGSPNRVVENLTGEGDTSRSQRSWTVAFSGYTDKHWGPAPVGSFEPNPFGLFDMGGNVGEWTRDCWHDTYIRAPVDGSAWINPGCTDRVIRGGYWASSPEQTRSAFRLFAKAAHHDARIGFRIARDL